MKVKAKGKRLTNAKMGIDSSEQRCSNAMEFILSVWYVVGGSWVPKLFSQTKVDDIHEMGGFACAHDEISWLDVTMDKGVGVDKLDSRYLEASSASFAPME
jgi:hypothetical protein